MRAAPPARPGPLSGVPRQLALPLLTYPPTHFRPAARHPGFAGEVSFSAKFICVCFPKNRLTAIQSRYQAVQRSRRGPPSAARDFSLPYSPESMHVYI